MPFRVPTILGEFNGKICSEWPQNASPTIWNFKIFRGKTPVSWRNPRLPERGVSPSRALPPLASAALGSCLWHSTLPLLCKLKLLLQFFLRTL